MAFNQNNWVKELLAWHGHDRGGVHVPFQLRQKPLAAVISTPIIGRLQQLATQLAAGDHNAPRWIFLVGGPGNGKSEAVEGFLRALDAGLTARGELIDVLSTKFSPSPLVPRRVEVSGADLGSAASIFAEHIGRLVVVQDATASDSATESAAERLAFDVTELLTEPARPVFIACVNRGLLTRALRKAAESYGHDATHLIASVLKVTSLSPDSGAAGTPSCWPIEDMPHVACWPMDFASLTAQTPQQDPALVQAVQHAVDELKWELAEACSDCDAREMCPFRQNAAWFRDGSTLESFRTIARRGELATGQRWNFRDMFTLTATMVVGERPDFEKSIHPCDWVKEHVSSLPALAENDDASAIPHLMMLMRHLYPHALFSRNLLNNQARNCEDSVAGIGEKPLSSACVSELCAIPSGNHSSVSAFLRNDYATLDPADYTPTAPTHPLYSLEMNYSQSVEQGNDTLGLARVSLIEARLLRLLLRAEAEWDVTRVNSAQAYSVIRLFRRLAATIAKRSIAVREGYHKEEEYLSDFELTLRSRAKLNQLKTELKTLLSEGGRLAFNAFESFGQPRPSAGGLATLQSGDVTLKVHPAPEPTADNPHHDLPRFSIGDGDDEYSMPITYTLFHSLRLQAAGCRNSSLAASVRTSIDRIRHLYAGAMCRDTNRILGGSVEISINGRRLQLDDETLEPYLEPI